MSISPVLSLADRTIKFTLAIILATASLAVLAVGQASAAVKTWTGLGGDNNFSTAANWSDESVPIAGDTVTLPTLSAGGDHTLNNDIGVALGGLTLSGTGDPTYYTINNLSFANNAVLARSGTAFLTVTGTVEAAGGITANSQTPFDYSGDDDLEITVTNLTLSEQAFYCGGGGAGVSMPMIKLAPTGTVTVKSGNSFSVNNSTNASAIVVESGGAVNFYDVEAGSVAYGGNITFSGGSVEHCSGQGVQSSLSAYANTTLTGTIALGGNVKSYVGGGKTLTISGPINGPGFSLSQHADSPGVLVNNSSSNNSTTPGGTQEKEAEVLPPITDNKPDESLSVNAKQIATLNGARGNVYVYADGILKGTGTAQNLYTLEGGIVAPGLSPGTLTVLDVLTLSEGAALEIEIKSLDAYDQLVVGAEDTSEAYSNVAIDGAILRVLAYEGFILNAGDQFTIIDNRSDNDVNGTFKDLPEGATFPFGQGGVLSISYVGGDGNDVVLTVVTVPTAPDTGVANIAVTLANPAVIAGLTLVSALALVVLARRAARR